MSKKNPVAVIIGAGPAGLTAAWELLQRTNIQPLVFEMTQDTGGISKTVNYKGNRIDIGGHRFFSKSDRVMGWWLSILPVETGGGSGNQLDIHYQGKQRKLDLAEKRADPEKNDEVFLIRQRLSRIFYLRRFFDYPLSLSLATLRNLGVARLFRAGISYARAALFPIKNERTLEDFFINRFGRELYRTFFKDYTEKVWGTSCRDIGADWGAQRIKGLSISKAVKHALGSMFRRDGDLAQKDTETSLIERFIYPKLGPGQLWEQVAKRVEAAGGELHYGWRASKLRVADGRIQAVRFDDSETGESRWEEADYVFSTMPVRELVASLGDALPADVREYAAELEYRDFMTVGLLLRRFRIAERTLGKKSLPDNWIYIQERDVKVGRVQVFNNWSPYMVADPDQIWIGLEYFCNEGDELWDMPDQRMIDLAIEEMRRLGFIEVEDVIDATVLRMPKAYPGYFGEGYKHMDEIRAALDGLENLFLVGRNGMHRYNNQDHSMLTSMVAVDNIVAGRTDKENVWSVNTEGDYHEQK